MKTKHIIGLVQINSGFSGQHYFPYSVGILQAYAEKNLPEMERFEFLPPIYRRIKVAEAVKQLEFADIVAFSVYVWNVNLSLAIAAELKRLKPETLVVFGGPQVPRHDRPWELEAFFRNHPFIDLAVHGAGEKPFAAILEHGISGNWSKIPSLTFSVRNPLFNSSEINSLNIHPLPGFEEKFHQTELAPSFKELTEIPSPYLSGTFNKLMALNPDERWIALWETDRNCPFSCTFCGWGLLEKKPTYWPIDQVFREVDWFAEQRIEFVFCANANFFLTPRDLDIARYVAEVKQKTGYPQRLSVQDAKNRAENVFNGRMILERAGLNTGVVISLQSVDPKTLEIIRRDNIKLETYQELQRRFRAENIETMTDVVLPLAGQTYDSFAEGISQIISHGQHNRINLNLCCVVPDAEMSHRDYMKKYGLEAIRTGTVNTHGQIENEEVVETQDLVVATAAMPKEDWIRALVFMWNVQFLYFNKILQIPIVVMREFTKLNYRDIIEFFSDGRFGSVKEFPILTRTQEFFRAKAKDIQQGGTEYVHAPDWLNVYWHTYEFVIMELMKKEELSEFFHEAERALSVLIKEKEVSVPEGILSDAIRLNQNLLKKPFQMKDIKLHFSWNIWEFYCGVVGGNPVQFKKDSFQFNIDCTTKKVQGVSNWWGTWDDWCREVIWFGYKRGTFFYGSITSKHQIAGHY